MNGQIWDTCRNFFFYSENSENSETVSRFWLQDAAQRVITIVALAPEVVN
jgi:hypothetical protein